MSRARGSRDAGFALIESIAVLALASLVLVTLLLASDLVTRNAGAAARRANNLETLATGLAALRQDIASAKLVRIGTGQSSRLLFHGRSGSLGLAVGEDRSDLGEGESLIWIEMQSDGDLTSLLRTSARLGPLTQSFETAGFSNPAILLLGPWTYRFSYADVGTALRWSETWTSNRKLPVAIRVEVFDKAGLRPLLPAMVVPLHINAEASCPDGSSPPCLEEEGEGENQEQQNDEEGFSEPT